MKEKISEIKKRIDAVKKENGLTQEVTIVAASKMVSAEKLNLLKECGITVCGENRVQELLEKFDNVCGISWHLIGSLQTNKVKYIIDKVDLIHSVDRPSLADEIDKQARKRGKVMDVLVEINTGEEESKSGVMPDKVFELMEYVKSKPNLSLKGVMGVFPVGADDILYQKLQEIFIEAKKRYGVTILSSGMSGDYEKAVKYGSTMVRIGSGIFGQRNYTQRN